MCSTYSPTSNEWKTKPRLTGRAFPCFNSVHQAKELHPGLPLAMHLVLTSLYLIHPATPYLPAASQQLHIMVVSTNCRNYGRTITISTRQGSLFFYLPLFLSTPLNLSIPLSLFSLSQWSRLEFLSTVPELVDKALALHLANEGFIPSIVYGPKCLNTESGE